MGIKHYKPTSPGRRLGSVLDFAEVTAWEPERSLIEAKRSTGGRNNLGRMTSRRRGGGAKKQYRRIDFRRDKDGIRAKVATIEYDPNRSAFIALLHYQDGEKRYILAPKGLKVGTEIYSARVLDPEIGYQPGVALPLGIIPVGLEVHNIEIHPGKGAQLVRAAGMTARLSAREGEHALILLPSGELRKVNIACRATIGQLGNLDHQNVRIGKAGRNRHRGRRPEVRGTAQNPVAHPMGGGEGRTGGGRHPCSPWGKLAKGGKTRKRRNVNDVFIIRRRNKK